MKMIPIPPKDCTTPFIKSFLLAAEVPGIDLQDTDRPTPAPTTTPLQYPFQDAGPIVRNSTLRVPNTSMTGALHFGTFAQQSLKTVGNKLQLVRPSIGSKELGSTSNHNQIGESEAKLCHEKKREIPKALEECLPAVAEVIDSSDPCPFGSMTPVIITATTTTTNTSTFSTSTAAANTNHPPRVREGAGTSGGCYSGSDISSTTVGAVEGAREKMRPTQSAIVSGPLETRRREAELYEAKLEGGTSSPSLPPKNASNNSINSLSLATKKAGIELQNYARPPSTSTITTCQVTDQDAGPIVNNSTLCVPNTSSTGTIQLGSPAQQLVVTGDKLQLVRPSIGSKELRSTCNNNQSGESEAKLCHEKKRDIPNTLEESLPAVAEVIDSSDPCPFGSMAPEIITATTTTTNTAANNTDSSVVDHKRSIIDTMAKSTLLTLSTCRDEFSNCTQPLPELCPNQNVGENSLNNDDSGYHCADDFNHDSDENSDGRYESFIDTNTDTEIVTDDLRGVNEGGNRGLTVTNAAIAIASSHQNNTMMGDTDIVIQSLPATSIECCDADQNRSANLTSLVVEADMLFTTSHTYQLMLQMRRCEFTAADAIYCKRAKLEIGFPGLACHHCFGAIGSRRFFPSTVETMCNYSKTVVLWHNHMILCECLDEIAKKNLSNLFALRKQERFEKKLRSETVFFAELWARLHKKSLKL
jgi:hypothetical protein